MTLTPPAEIEHFDVGSLVYVASDPFRDEHGVPTDPTDVTLIYQAQGKLKVTVALADLTHDGPGVWSYRLDTTGSPGRWWYRFVGTGHVQAAADGQFYVDDSPLIR